MNPNSANGRTIFRVSPVRLAPGEYISERKLGEGDIYASYSADRIASALPVRKPFRFNGKLWLCISIAGRGTTLSAEAEFEAYELVPVKLFQGKVRHYGEQVCDSSGRGDLLQFYHGIVVRHANRSFVMTGPAVIFIGQKETHANVQLSLF